METIEISGGSGQKFVIRGSRINYRKFDNLLIKFCGVKQILSIFSKSVATNCFQRFSLCAYLDASLNFSAQSMGILPWMITGGFASHKIS